MHLKFRIDERERSGTAEHLCVCSRTSSPNIFTFLKIRENLPNIEHGTCKAVNPGKKGPDIIECFKEWVESDIVEE